MPNDKIEPQILSPEDNELANHIRDLTFELMSRHETPEHAGHPCGMNRVGHIAWLAHCLGVTTRHLSKLMALISYYESGCPCGAPELLDEHFNNDHA